MVTYEENAHKFEKSEFKQVLSDLIDGFEANVERGFSSGTNTSWLDAFNNHATTIAMTCDFFGLNELAKRTVNSISAIKDSINRRENHNPTDDEKEKLLFIIKSIKDSIE